MYKITFSKLVGTLAVLLIPACAYAHVLDPSLDKAAFKLRADVAKQVAGYASCVSKAALKCESKGELSSPECDVETGTVAYEPVPGVATDKFQGALATCAEKLDLTKKGTDYEGIGCPGDCSIDAGLQACTDLPAYGTDVTAALRSTLADLAVSIDDACAAAGTPSSTERIECVAAASKELSKYMSSLLKCAQKCENDAKGTKGGGADTNLAQCATGTGDPAFVACDDKAAEKLGATALTVRSAVASVVNDLTEDLFNREDATDTDSPAGNDSPCGDCGDGEREGTEDCDGTDFGSCDACAADCTCTAAVCGNDVLEGGEDCDGSELGSCDECNSSCGCIVDPILDGDSGTFCSTLLSAATTDYQAICAPTESRGRHFRIEGIQTTGNNGFAYLALGFPEFPTGNPTFGVGDGRFIFTAGKSQSCTYAWSYFRYSGITDPSVAQLCTVPSVFGEYPNGPQTVCMDVTEDNPPRVTFWATGKNGADCKIKSTLTEASAAYSKDDWASANNQPVNATFNFVKLNNTAAVTFATAAVSSNTVLP